VSTLIEVINEFTHDLVLVERTLWKDATMIETFRNVNELFLPLDKSLFIGIC